MFHVIAVENVSTHTRTQIHPQDKSNGKVFDFKSWNEKEENENIDPNCSLRKQWHCVCVDLKLNEMAFLWFFILSLARKQVTDFGIHASPSLNQENRTLNTTITEIKIEDFFFPLSRAEMEWNVNSC